MFAIYYLLHIKAGNSLKIVSRCNIANFDAPIVVMEEMNVMMEAMVTFMETGEIDDLKPMLEKVQNVETHVDETMKNMGMNSTFDEMSQEVVVAMETQMAEVQNNMNEM